MSDIIYRQYTKQSIQDHVKQSVMTVFSDNKSLINTMKDDVLYQCEIAESDGWGCNYESLRSIREINKVYQKIIDKGIGNCMRACVCTLLNIDDSNVPNFIEGNYEQLLSKTLADNNCEEKGMLWNPNLSYFNNPTECCFERIRHEKSQLLDAISDYKGIDGLFIASVFSPRYFNYSNGIHQTHAVIIDKQFNIVHDPNPNYKNIFMYPLSKLIKYNGIRNVYLIERII